MTTKPIVTKQTGEFREYAVVFTDDRDIPWPWFFFTRKGFRHCEVYVGIGDKSFCVCQTLMNVEFVFYDADFHSVMQAAKEAGGKVIYVATLRKPRKYFRLGIIIPTCISLCQKITGWSFNSFTPYGYYKALLKHGGIEL